jgi:hypothetical protein
MTPSSLETQIIVLKIIIFINLIKESSQDNVWIMNQVNYYPGKKKLNKFFTSVLSQAVPGF